MTKCIVSLAGHIIKEEKDYCILYKREKYKRTWINKKGRKIKGKRKRNKGVTMQREGEREDSGSYL